MSADRHDHPWLFFAVVFCWTWLFWVLAAALGIGVHTGLGRTLFLLGLLGPAIGGIGFTYAARNENVWREYWVRVVDPGRIPLAWYLIIFLFVPALLAVAVLFDLASGGSIALTRINERIVPLLVEPWRIVSFLFVALFIGPLPEELGWRGYVLDRLQARWNALVSSLILGAIWAVWHLPLFFIKDTYHHSQGAWSAWFWLFMISVVPLSVATTWVFNNTRHSTLAAILLHLVANVTYEIGNATTLTNLYATALWFVAVAAIACIWGPATLTRCLPRT